MTDLIRFPNAMRPAWVYNDDPARGMGPAVFLTGANWGSWQGDLLVGIMGAQQLWRLEINAQNNSTRQIEVQGDEDGNPFTPTRFRALTLAPDNSLYVVNEDSEDSTIYRVVASAPGGGDAPAPASGAAPAPAPSSGGGSGGGGSGANAPETGSGGTGGGSSGAAGMRLPRAALVVVAVVAGAAAALA